MEQKIKRYEKNKSQSIDLNFGKLPPQARELEDAVLGAIMLEKNAYDIVSELLQPEVFYSEANQKVYATIQSLAKRNLPIDLLTVIDDLKTKEELENVGGAYYITTLTNAVVSSANIEYHACILNDYWVKRELIEMGAELVGNAYDDTVFPNIAIEKLEKKLTLISTDKAISGSKDITSLLMDAVTRIEKLRLLGSNITGIPSGFDDIDKITHGWQDTDLIILAARPSVGKTAMALNFARNASVHFENNKINNIQKSVAFFSLEMSAGQLIERFISCECEIDLEKIKTGKVSESDLNIINKKGLTKLSSSKIIIDDTAALNIYSLRSRCRTLKRKNNLGLVIIDYLQLMSGDTNDSKNREREISQISRELKKIAKEIQIPIIALSQLSREVEKRKGEAQMPKLSDLRESGAIEQDADMVMFLYRPEYHGDNSDAFGESTKGLTYVSIAKHRNGNLANGNDAIPLQALLQYQKFIPGEKANTSKFNNNGNWRPVTNFYEKEELNFD